MQRKPQAKSQADILVRELAAAGVALKHQKALELVAKLHGFKGWNEMSKAPEPASTAGADAGADGKLAALMAKAQSVVDNADNVGCDDDLTVTSHGAVEELKDFLNGLGGRYSDNPLLRFNPKRQVAILWGIEDVQSVRPDLTDEEALDVLQTARRKHDANEGINWDVLRIHASYAYAERKVNCTARYKADGQSVEVPVQVNLANGRVRDSEGKPLQLCDATLHFEGITETFEVTGSELFDGEAENLLKLTALLKEADELPEAVYA